MSLFDELLEKEEYKKLYENLPDDERPIVMEAMRKLVEQFEKTILIPLKNSDIVKGIK